jgi:hypothetical protein
MKSFIVPTVKSSMMYMPRECISSIRSRQSSSVPQWGSVSEKSMGEYESACQGMLT